MNDENVGGRELDRSLDVSFKRFGGIKNWMLEVEGTGKKPLMNWRVFKGNGEQN